MNTLFDESPSATTPRPANRNKPPRLLETQRTYSRTTPRAVRQEPLSDRQSRQWDRETELLITWWEYSQHLLPTDPFDLRPGERVIDPARFFSALQCDLADGPDGAPPFKASCSEISKRSALYSDAEQFS